MPTPIARRSDLACAILAIGAVAYALLCVPAIGRRGYPPIDPFWLGVTHLWFVPVGLSGVFDSYSFKSRRRQLALYAIVTAFFNAGTIHTITPRHVTLVGMLAFAVFPYGPIHLAGTFAIEALTQFLLCRNRTLVDEQDPPRGLPQVTLLSWFVGYTVICLAIGTPFAYRSIVVTAEKNRAVAAADEDWRDGVAVLYSPGEQSLIDDVEIDFHVDRETGLLLRHRAHDLGFADAYNARIRELIRIHGVPSWNVKGGIPQAEELVHLLDAGVLSEVTEFPCYVTPEFVLLRGGSVTFGSSTYSSGGPGLSIASEKGGLMGVGQSKQKVYAQVNGRTVIVRNGSDWIGVFHEDGGLIATAQRFPWANRQSAKNAIEQTDEPEPE